MCLYSRHQRPMVAKKDIRVLKYLKQFDSEFRTPYQCASVTLDQELTAKGKATLEEYGTDHLNHTIYELGGGAIHAKLHEASISNCCKLAIIPKGTKYWVDPFGLDIAAEKMIITSQDGSNKLLGNDFDEEILNNAPSNNGVRVGDYYLVCGKFTHPKKGLEREKVCGIVCGFYKNGTPMICALDLFENQMWDKYYNSQIDKYTEDRDKALKLFNGKEVMDKYLKHCTPDSEKTRYQAFETCANYRKDKGEEWFMGACGEVTTMLDNTIFLNAAHAISGLGFHLDSDSWFWTCSEGYSNYSWYCCLYCGRVYCRWNFKYCHGSIVPFYAYKGKKTFLQKVRSIWK